MEISECNFILVKEKFPGLSITNRNNTYIISGMLKLNHLYNEVRMTGSFDIEIKIFEDFPNSIPIVRELSENINRKYPHISSSGQLCLATNLELKMYFSKNRDISSFINEYVIPYLYSYCYFEKYGIYPYGERSHGSMGELEYLKELFQVDDWKQVLDIMIFLTQNKYRGHLPCPCKSGKRIRNCHGDIIIESLNSGYSDDCIEILNRMLEEINKKNGKYN